MKVWIDADACPKPIKDILFRMAMRLQIESILVSNHVLSIPASPYIKKVQVPVEFDAADKYILDKIEENDLVITADVLLADGVVSKKGTALNPRGTLYSTDNMKHHLSLRNLNTESRSAGIMTGGPSALSKKDIQLFANHLDKYLTKITKSS